MRASILRSCLVLIVFILGGCSTWHDLTITKRSTIDSQIVAARAETETKLKALENQQTDILRQIVTVHEAREQAAADSLFKGQVVYSSLKLADISRPTMVMGQSIQQTATQLPPATAAAQAAAFKALQTELDETKVTTEALRTQYEAELGRARTDGETKTQALIAAKAKIDAIETERVNVLTKARETDATLQATKDKIQDKDTADARRAAEEAKNVQTIKIRMSSIVGGLALLCLAGAIWSPVMKEKFGLGAAILGLASVAIFYIQGWMVALTVGLLIAILIAWAAKNHYIESKTATNLIHAVQEVKDRATDDYNRVLRPHLTEWMKKYDKSGNKVVDQSVIDHVDQVLMNSGTK